MAAVAVRSEGAVSRLVLTRPEALNALSEETAAEFAAAVRGLGRSNAKVVVLEGQGAAFCAGGDLRFIEMNAARPKAELAPLMRRFYSAFLSIRSLPQITIAKVHGSAVGAGLCLALACDLRVVAADARLAFNFVKLGLNPGMAAWPLARAALGDARARELLMTGRFFAGRELLAWGGASAAPSERAGLDAAAEGLAAEVAAASASALRALKDETRLGADLGAFLALEAREQARAFKGADVREGLAAIRDRRAPRFAA